jgi:hypothetical protein
MKASAPEAVASAPDGLASDGSFGDRSMMRAARPHFAPSLPKCGTAVLGTSGQMRNRGYSRNVRRGANLHCSYSRGGHHEELASSNRDVIAARLAPASCERSAAPEKAFFGSAPAPSILRLSSRFRGATDFAHCARAKLSGAAGAHHRRLSAWRQH